VSEAPEKQGEWTAPRAGERRSPLPNFLTLPARGWRSLPGRGRAAVVALAAVLVAVAVALVPPALDNASENEANERAAIAKNRERMRRALTEEQRPRWTVLPRNEPVGPSLAAHVQADARVRVREGTMEGPIGNTECKRIERTGEDRRFATFTCLVERGGRGTYRGRDLLLGYRFRGRVELKTGSAAWCKENPPPLHGDQEEFVKVPVSRECTG
jgi:hypothetical protein